MARAVDYPAILAISLAARDATVARDDGGADGGRDGAAVRVCERPSDCAGTFCAPMRRAPGEPGAGPDGCAADEPPCASEETCDEGAARCVAVSCGEGQLCRDGACVPDPCFGVECNPGERCVSGTCVSDGTSDAGGGRLDAGGGRMDAGRGVAPTDGGCGCRASGGSPGTPWLLALALFMIGLRRR